MRVKGYVALSKGTQLTPFEFERREPGPRDVVVELQYCGICFSDIHNIEDDLGYSVFPMVPGHEMVGRVIRTGSEVTKFRPGDIAGIGCFIDSCRKCSSCAEGLENYCEEFPTPSFSAYERGTTNIIYGGFSGSYVLNEDFALKVSPKLDPAGAAPLLCGGITTYSALRYLKVGKGHRVCIVGIGGLGHLAVKFARALGAHVTALTTSARKVEDALRLGADEVAVSTDPEAMAGLAKSFDFVIDTISVDHDFDALIGLTKRDGEICLLGLPHSPVAFSAMGIIAGRRKIIGSGVGGIPETQEMLDFCAEHGIMADVEVLPISDVNDAIERLKRNDVKYRFVLDLAELSLA